MCFVLFLPTSSKAPRFFSKVAPTHLALAAVATAAGAEPAFHKGNHHGRAAARRERRAPLDYVAVSEKTLDGHIDDIVWATKDAKTMFLVY